MQVNDILNSIHKRVAEKTDSVLLNWNFDDASPEFSEYFLNLPNKSFEAKNEEFKVLTILGREWYQNFNYIDGDILISNTMEKLLQCGLIPIAVDGITLCIFFSYTI